MKIRSLSTLTRTYVLALSLIAFLTLTIFITMHQVISTQKDSARLVNVSGSQRFLSQKTALLSIELIFASKLNDQDLVRKQILRTTEEIQKNHQELLQGSPAMILAPRYLLRYTECILT